MPKQTDTVVIDPAEDLPAFVAQQAVELAALRLALTQIHNIGQAARMVETGRIVEIARGALTPKAGPG